MSHPVPETIYRIAAAAGCGSAVVLLINAAKRAEVIPTSAFTQLVAPLAQILALALVTALYLAFGRRTGTFGLVAFLLNAFSLAALVGVEFVINLVFRDIPDDTVQVLRTSSTNTVQLDHHGLFGWPVGLGPVVVMGSFDVPPGVFAFDHAGVGAGLSSG